MDPDNFVGTMVLVFSLIFAFFGLVYLPHLRRKELKEIREQKLKPIRLQIQGSSQCLPLRP